jgi:hypothetical protein
MKVLFLLSVSLALCCLITGCRSGHKESAHEESGRDTSSREAAPANAETSAGRPVADLPDKNLPDEDLSNDGFPETIDPQARYLFYLHGQIVEDKGLRPVHPRLGVYEYEAIRDTLAARGPVVISEARTSGTDVWKYAQKVTAQVNRLLAAGVPPEHITVAGHSKGGAIAILTSSLLQNDRVNHVLLACCGDWMATNPHVQLSGRILSIYDISDHLAGSCLEAFDRASKPMNTKEIRLDTGHGHGAFYRPMREWIDPLMEWLLAAKTP